jgi:hypothetical protein
MEQDEDECVSKRDIAMEGKKRRRCGAVLIPVGDQVDKG